MADSEGAVDLGQEYLQDDQIDQQVLADDEGPPGLNVSAGGEEQEGGVEDAVSMHQISISIHRLGLVILIFFFFRNLNGS